MLTVQMNHRQTHCRLRFHRPGPLPLLQISSTHCTDILTDGQSLRPNPRVIWTPSSLSQRPHAVLTVHSSNYIHNLSTSHNLSYTRLKLQMKNDIKGLTIGHRSRPSIQLPALIKMFTFSLVSIVATDHIWLLGP